VPASDPAFAGMRRHVRSRNHAAESFVSFIPLFDDVVIPHPYRTAPDVLLRLATFTDFGQG
jgi:hypothetical protein